LFLLLLGGIEATQIIVIPNEPDEKLLERRLQMHKGTRRSLMIENKTIEHVQDVIEDCGYLVCDRHTMPGRNPIFAPNPPCLHKSLCEKLRQLYPNGLYKLQVGVSN
jgi:hypothetical protein